MAADTVRICCSGTLTPSPSSLRAQEAADTVELLVSSTRGQLRVTHANSASPASAVLPRYSTPSMSTMRAAGAQSPPLLSCTTAPSRGPVHHGPNGRWFMRPGTVRLPLDAAASIARVPRHVLPP